MGFAGSKKMIGLIFWLLVLALILQAIGTFYDSWWDSEAEMMSDTITVSGGLWAICIDTPSVGFVMCSMYGDLSSLDAWFIAVRALALAGAVIIFLAMICCFAAVTSVGGKMFRLVTSLLCFLAFIMTVAEWMVFLVKIEEDGVNSLNQWEDGSPPSTMFDGSMDPAFEYSINFIITILVNIICLITGILAIVSWRAKDTEVWAS